MSSQAAVAAAIAKINFRDPQRATQNLARIATAAPASVNATLVGLLDESPDPDSALNLFEKLYAAASEEPFRLFERHQFLLHYALAVFGHSHFLGETLIQNQDLFQAIVREKKLERLPSPEELRESFARFRSRSMRTDTALLLARFKRREYVRIMLRDVLGIATLAETTAEISALADVLIAEALRDADAALRDRYGPPQHRDISGRLVETPFAVLSLGKLGGNELNYSSDIDLFFIYGDGEEPASTAISNREYFIRLAQQITETLSRVTSEGSAFRVDLRLRPQGGEGEPTVALTHALRYYAHTARDWELQAMIKVRHSAGELPLAREFIRGVQPYVYTPKLNFAAIETALEARRRMLFGSRRNRAAIDVKLDRGGIRDIEFLVQCLQRVYGGAETWLRSSGTLFSLQKLHDKGHISGKDFHQLTSSYEFLRRVEHRLQLRRGQQTHRLPESEAELHILSRSLAGSESAENSPAGVATLVGDHMAGVAAIYRRIVHQEQVQQERHQSEAEFRLQSSLVETGRESPSSQVLRQLSADAPQLYELCTRPDLSAHARRNLHRFLSASFTNSERYAAVLAQPPAMERALMLFESSDYLTELLVRHPEEIATLTDINAEIARQPFSVATRTLFQDDHSRQSANHISDPVFAYLASSSLPASEKMALLRRHYRKRLFAAEARDLMEARRVYASLAETTAATDDAIAAALAISGRPEQFAILALGRLGTREFDLLSDADLLFLRDESANPRQALKTAEQIVGTLAAYTRDGILFAVDTRLRPRGAEGELVVTPSQLATYFENEAQPWEALTYTKLRFVAGEKSVAERALKSVAALSKRFRRSPDFTTAIREMRAKLEHSEAGEGNFKTAPGGFYDIDFIVSTRLAGGRLASQSAANIHQRIQALAEHHLLGEDDALCLQQAAELLRTLEHVVRLVLGRTRKSLPARGHTRQTAEQLTSRILGREFSRGLQAELESTFQRVREIYDRVLQ